MLYVCLKHKINFGVFILKQMINILKSKKMMTEKVKFISYILINKTSIQCRYHTLVCKTVEYFVLYSYYCLRIWSNNDRIIYLLFYNSKYLNLLKICNVIRLFYFFYNNKQFLAFFLFRFWLLLVNLIWQHCVVIIIHIHTVKQFFLNI